MKKISRILALVLVIALLPLLSSCGKDGTKSADKNEKFKAKVYETDLLSVKVPKGWKVLSQPEKPESAYVYKGKKDAYSSPSISITYFEPKTEMLSPKAMFEDAKDIEPVKIGKYTWEGFTAVSVGYPITVLSMKKPHQLQVDIFNEVEDQKISLKDDDVQFIISSIKIK